LGLVRVKNVENKTEVQIARNELADYLYRIIHHQKGELTPVGGGEPIQPTLASSQSMQYSQSQETVPNPSSIPSPANFLDVEIIGSDSAGSKQKRKICTMANQRIALFCSKLMVNPRSLKVVALVSLL
jgi:hypothetical protein